MKRIISQLLVIPSFLVATSAFAAPDYLITHNKTNVESNAYVGGVPSPHPTHANSDGKVAWLAVQLACFKNTDSKQQCKAMIKMATNTSNPVELGVVSVNLQTGDINPKQLSKNGYTLTVNGPGEATVEQN